MLDIKRFRSSSRVKAYFTFYLTRPFRLNSYRRPSYTKREHSERSISPRPDIKTHLSVDKSRTRDVSPREFRLQKSLTRTTTTFQRAFEYEGN